MLEYLDTIEPNQNVSLAQGVKDFCLRNTGQGILVLITDLMDKSGYETALRFLLAQQLDVYVIHLLSQEEIELALKLIGEACVELHDEMAAQSPNPCQCGVGE